ncbi:MAG: RNA polymerase sigma factor [Armatimonadota bacterium]
MDYELSLGRQSVLKDDENSVDQDQALVKAMSDGDRNAWNSFFDRFSGWTYRFAYYHLNRNHADAEDLCSDILLAAVRDIKKYDATRGSLDVWLLGIARHRLSRFCRRRHKDISLTPEITVKDIDGMLQVNGLEDQVLMREDVHSVLASLPERQATALIGKYVEGYSTEELARIMGTSPKAVEMLIRRGKSMCKAALNAMTGGCSDE